MPEAAKNQQAENKIKAETNKNIANAMNNSVQNIAKDILKKFEENFSDVANVKINETASGFFKVCATNKNLKERATSQIEVTVTKDGKVNVHLNDYDNYDKFYYFGDRLTKNELNAELRNFNAFLHGQGMSENSKLTKEVYFNPEDY